MASTPEKKVKDKFKKALLSIWPDAYIYMPVPGGFGKRGVPDFIICIDGNFIGVEAKSGDKGLTKLQERNLDQIHKAGGTSIVIYGESKIEYAIGRIRSITDKL